MTRPVLAGLVGRSTDWLKKIETGVRPLNSLPLLIELARALDVDDLSELTGDDFDAPVRGWEKDIHHVVPAIREAMRDAPFGPALDGTTPPIVDAEELASGSARGAARGRVGHACADDHGRDLRRLPVVAGRGGTGEW